jgi:hypothetical protein
MMAALVPILSGAAATLSFVIALYFLRFWTRTSDAFHLLFALAFALDGAGRLGIEMIRPSDASEAYAYLPRLVVFLLIIAAVVLKNRGQDE